MPFCHICPTKKVGNFDFLKKSLDRTTFVFKHVFLNWSYKKNQKCSWYCLSNINCKVQYVLKNRNLSQFLQVSFFYSKRYCSLSILWTEKKSKLCFSTLFYFPSRGMQSVFSATPTKMQIQCLQMRHIGWIIRIYDLFVKLLFNFG